MGNEMVRFPSELIEAAAKVAHADGKSTSTWIRDLVAGEVFRRQFAIQIDWDAEGQIWGEVTRTWASGFPVEYKQSGA